MVECNGVFSCFGGIYFLELFLAVAVALQLFSELTAKEATTFAATLFTIPVAVVHDGGKEEP